MKASYLAFRSMAAATANWPLAAGGQRFSASSPPEEWVAATCRSPQPRHLKPLPARRHQHHECHKSSPPKRSRCATGFGHGFQVQVFSAGYGAEYGRSSGGVLNSITRSGTSEFHGTLFEFFATASWMPATFLTGISEPPPFKRNQFGFTLTGPLQNDRTFFLFSYEGLRDRLTETNISFFPDEEARSGFPDSSGAPTVPVAPSVKPYLELDSRAERSPVGTRRGPQRGAPVFADQRKFPDLPRGPQNLG